MLIVVCCRIGCLGVDYDGLLYCLFEGGFVIEFEWVGLLVDLMDYIVKVLDKICIVLLIWVLCEEVVMLFQDWIGYDWVMVYCFDDEGYGEVFFECCKLEFEVYFGNCYLVIDILQMVCWFYECMCVCVFVDVNYQLVLL